MKRTICIWLAFAVLLVLAMFPPWVVIRAQGSELFPSQNVVSAGLMPIRHPRIDQFPMWITQNLVAVVDYKKLLGEIVMWESFVLALYLTWGRKQDEKKK
ncbi:MAG TPA: hypothetical protein VMW15_03115 [Terracidiphilus sp.]|nr:hypothetical protein [Terracidiphilus sp.]